MLQPRYMELRCVGISCLQYLAVASEVDYLDPYVLGIELRSVGVIVELDRAKQLGFP